MWRVRLILRAIIDGRARAAHRVETRSLKRRRSGADPSRRVRLRPPRRRRSPALPADRPARRAAGLRRPRRGLPALRVPAREPRRRVRSGADGGKKPAHGDVALARAGPAPGTSTPETPRRASIFARRRARRCLVLATLIGGPSSAWSSGSGSRCTPRSTPAARGSRIPRPLSCQRERRGLARHEVRAGRDDLAARGEEAVARLLGQHHDRHVALQVGLLVDGEQDAAVLDRLEHLGLEVERADLDARRAAAELLGVERRLRAARVEREHAVGLAALDRGRELRRGHVAVLDVEREHLRAPAGAAHRARERRAADVERLVADLLVDADRVAHARRREPLAGAAPGRRLRLPDVGEDPELAPQVRARVDRDDRDAGAHGAPDRRPDRRGRGSRRRGRRACVSTASSISSRMRADRERVGRAGRRPRRPSGARRRRRRCGPSTRTCSTPGRG